MKDIVTLINDIHDAHRLLEEQDGLDHHKSSPPMGKGSTEREVAGLEERLGVRLPPSYRSFLLRVNGCDHLGLSHGGLLPAERVDWFRSENEDWVRAYFDNGDEDISEKEHRVYGPDQDCTRFRRAYLAYLLQIGEVYDGSVYLLNPEVRDAEGEYEAWCLSGSYPGAYRWPSFQALVEETWRKLRREVRLGSLRIDAESIISEALPVLRRAVLEGRVSPTAAIAKYIREKGTHDENFSAWIRHADAYEILLHALEHGEAEGHSGFSS